MKTFIVYNLDTGSPIAVGEAIKAEWARIETADKTKIRAENLIAEEIAIQIVRPSQYRHVFLQKRFWNKSRGNG
jgi:hypothetical protein